MKSFQQKKATLVILNIQTDMHKETWCTQIKLLLKSLVEEQFNQGLHHLAASFNTWTDFIFKF